MTTTEDNRVSKMLDQLVILDEKYWDTVVLVIEETLGVALPACCDCHRAMYPRRQWQQIPEEVREHLKKWFNVSASYGRCTTCYRLAVRDGKVKTVRKGSSESILSPNEIAYLRRMARGIK
jgi:hypothetical protein